MEILQELLKQAARSNVLLFGESINRSMLPTAVALADELVRHIN